MRKSFPCRALLQNNHEGRKTTHVAQQRPNRILQILTITNFVEVSGALEVKDNRLLILQKYTSASAPEV